MRCQLENEYGAFGSDDAYLRALREALQDAGFDASPYYTIDQPGDLVRGSLPDVPIAVTFAPGDPGVQFAQVRSMRPSAPLLCGEYWAGWFDHWGEPHATSDDDQQVNDLEWMLSRGVSVNVYMFHGGTNFGFWNGANAFDPHPYQPTTTSYDYRAALDEAGRPTEKFFRFREAIARHAAAPLVEVPASPRVGALRRVQFERCLPLDACRMPCIESDRPQPMENFGQYFGYVLYRTTLPGPGSGILEIDELRDYGVVALDGAVIAHLDRRLGESRIDLRCEGERATLDILVENCGRINYGPALSSEQKGITRDVRWRGDSLRGWRMYPLSLEVLDGARWLDRPCDKPAFYCVRFDLEEPSDTFLDVRQLRKGALWVNGRNAGRFWHIGPQCSLYVPAVWLHPGLNELMVFDVFGHRAFPSVCGSERPIVLASETSEII